MAFLPALAGIASVGGTILSAAGSIRQGQEADAAAQTAAMQDERQAMVERAKASREAYQQLLEQRRILSDQQAVASADGGSATDPSLLVLAGDVGGYGYQQRQGILAGGENTARGYDDSAIARRASGKSALAAGRVGAFGSLLSGVTSAATTYGDYMKSKRLT